MLEAVSGSVMACAGNGNCLKSSGTCDCFRGYSGANCTACTRDYLRTSTPRGTRCVFLAPAALSSCSDGVRSGNEEGVDCGGACPNACTATSSKGSGLPLSPMLLGAAAGGAALLCCLCCLGACLYKKRQKAEKKLVKRKGAAGGGGGKVEPWWRSFAGGVGAKKKKKGPVRVIKTSMVMPAVVNWDESADPPLHRNTMNNRDPFLIH
jgi:hypothetical protein